MTLQGESIDRWRPAILAERKYNYVHSVMIDSVERYIPVRKNALLLGDASLIQSKYLLDIGKFSHVTNVDCSPTLLDDEIISLSDKRLERVVETFDQYDFSSRTFNFVYGKSIAFNPKPTVFSLVAQIEQSLDTDGIFAAVWAGSADTFRPIHYSKEELLHLYKSNNLEIISFTDQPAARVKGLLDEGIAHNLQIVARKKS
jgi:hypothetical protein